jgi:hypothetical protein
MLHFYNKCQSMVPVEGLDRTSYVRTANFILEAVEAEFAAKVFVDVMFMQASPCATRTRT